MSPTRKRFGSRRKLTLVEAEALLHGGRRSSRKITECGRSMQSWWLQALIRTLPWLDYKRAPTRR